MPKSDQGVTDDRYRVIPRCLIFLFDHDRVLLIKGSPLKRLWANLYNGIGGHIERSEDILSSARRELLEETGLVSPDLVLCGVLMVDASPATGIGIFLFKGHYGGGEIQPSREGMLEWVPLNKIGMYPLVEDLKVVLPRIAAWEPGSAPLSGRSYYDEEDHLRVVFND